MGRITDTPLFDAVRQYESRARFHMPGHSGDKNISPLYASADYDITELDFSDNLLSANGIIAESERLTAQAYGSSYCLYFTAGATTALFTAIRTAKDFVDKVYCLNQPHKSIINGFELFGVDYEIVCSLPDHARAVVITSPDYYGNVIDVKSVRQRLKDALIIVDEAHGAHFAYSSFLPDNVTSDADFVINGLHKTLPVFTGGAILRTDRDDLYLKAIYYRTKIHTTSPSYLTMCSMDFARGYMSEYGEKLYAELKSKVDGLILPQGYSRLETDDFSRLVISVPDGVSGYDVSADMQKKGVYFELVESDKLVSILTPFNIEKIDLLKLLPISPAKRKKRDLSEFVGKIALADVGLYPPGKVLVKKGELITEDIIKILNRDAERVFGLE